MIIRHFYIITFTCWSRTPSHLSFLRYFRICVEVEMCFKKKPPWNTNTFPHMLFHSFGISTFTFLQIFCVRFARTALQDVLEMCGNTPANTFLNICDIFDVFAASHTSSKKMWFGRRHSKKNSWQPLWTAVREITNQTLPRNIHWHAVALPLPPEVLQYLEHVAYILHEAPLTNTIHQVRAATVWKWTWFTTKPPHSPYNHLS